MFLGSDSKRLCHASVCTMAGSLLWSVVKRIRLEQGSLALNGFPKWLALQHAVHALRFAFGNADAKLVCGAKPVPTSFACDATTPIQSRMQFIKPLAAKTRERAMSIFAGCNFPSVDAPFNSSKPGCKQKYDARALCTVRMSNFRMPVVVEGFVRTWA